MLTESAGIHLEKAAVLEGWCTAELHEIGVWSGGGTPSKQNPQYWLNGNIPWVSPKDMKVDRISETIDYITKKAVVESSTKIIPKHSVLIVTRSGILSRILPIAINLREVAVNQDLKVLSPIYADCNFILYVLKRYSDDILRTCSKTGTTVASVDFNKLKAFKIPFPPLKEQHRIVTKIEALTTRSRKAREALDAIPTLLDQFRQSVLAAAFRGDLTADWRAQNPDVEPAEKLLERIRVERRSRWQDNEKKRKLLRGSESKKKGTKKYSKPVEADNEQELNKPDSWIVVSADQVTFLITDGKHGDCVDETASGYFFLSVKDLYDGRLHYENARQISKIDFLEVHYRTNLEAGDVLVTNAGTIGRVAIAQDRAKTSNTTFQKSVAILKPLKTAILSEYLALYTENCVSHLKGKSSGTAVKNLLLRDLKKFAITLPSLSEQREIVHCVESLLSSIQHFERNYTEAFTELDQLDQSILAKAFRGKLVSQDPTDEPASVLLQRIQAEREKLNAKTKKKKTRAKKKK